MSTSLFAGKKNICQYRDPDNDLFQVILPGFTLTKTRTGTQIEIEIKDTLFNVRNLDGKRAFQAAVKRINRKNQARIIQNLEAFTKVSKGLSFRFEEPEYYFRYANGGALPILRIQDETGGRQEHYFCFFYREIFPIGWNIANGASDNRNELFNPSDIIRRELNEELLIADNTQHLRYVSGMDAGGRLLQTPGEALNCWEENTGLRLRRYGRLYLPVKWIDGPDSIIIRKGKLQTRSDGYFLNITPGDNAIELDRIGLFNLAGDLSLYDCELSNGHLINAVIGLFKVDGFEKKLDGDRFMPDRIFFNGMEHDVNDLERLLSEVFIPQLGPCIRKKEKDAWFNARNTFDLCPATRAVVTNYYGLMKKQGMHPQEALNTGAGPGGKRAQEGHDSRYDIFLACTPDNDIQAARLRDCLAHAGKTVFFSPEHRWSQGNCHDAERIAAAAEKSEAMVVFGSGPAGFDSGWTSYAWRSFFNDIRFGRKPAGRLITVTSSVNAHDLPQGLRSVRTIGFRPDAVMETADRLMMCLP